MAFVNRSNEFFAMCQSIPPSTNNPSQSDTSSSTTNTSTNRGRYGAGGHADLSDPTSELRTFHKRASELSQKIHSTSALLTQLTSLIHSRSRSLFVDESSQVNSLISQIKINIQYLNQQLDETQDIILRNRRKLGGKNSQAGMEANNLVGQLREEFVSTTKGFKEALRVRGDLMKERSDKRGRVFERSGDAEEDSLATLGNKPRVYQSDTNDNNKDTNTNLSQNRHGLGVEGGSMGLGVYGGNSSLSAAPKLDLDLTSGLMNTNRADNVPNMPGGESTTQLPRPYNIYSERGGSSSMGIRQRVNAPSSYGEIPTYSGSVSSYDPNNNYSNNDGMLPIQSPLDIQRMEEQSGQSQAMQLIPDQNYLRERADAMTQVESHIVELGTIFNKLAVMVGEQQEMVQRVEDNVNDANDNINLSMATLSDTLHNSGPIGHFF
eukprot:CAMPEP_0184864802 /NCGR_PEP_ID=MMETSP0580-20130426/16096_1 /TAXON_ID=1118495 /ORGANISM="Dactyliosolen fragilissimus" /LENGTH=434 /DNA_ID=CAMNT_0027363721 /DNA_START=116 /DNA_END=1421 /DNA_ORIENTATION=-